MSNYPGPARRAKIAGVTSSSASRFGFGPLDGRQSREILALEL